MLRTWRKRQAEDRLAVGGALPAHGLVLTLEDGAAPHPDTTLQRVGPPGEGP